MARKLNEVEVSLNENAIEKNIARIEELQAFLIPKTKLELRYGLPLSFKRTVEQYREAIKDWEDEAVGLAKTNKALQDQIDQGVEEK